MCNPNFWSSLLNHCPDLDIYTDWSQKAETASAPSGIQPIQQESHQSPPSTLNPEAKEFIPSFLRNPPQNRTPEASLQSQRERFSKLEIPKPLSSSVEEAAATANPVVRPKHYKNVLRVAESTSLCSQRTLNVRPKKTLEPTPLDLIQILAKECGHNLTEEICNAIRSAKNCIRIKIYNLSSEAILQALAQKASEGVSIWIHYQVIKNHEKFNFDKNPLVSLYPNTKTHTNLQHKKEIIIDEKMAILGTANFTQGALVGDVNCLIKVLSPQLCYLMKQNRSGDCLIGGRRCRYLSLYRSGPDAVPEIIQHIDKAKHSIRLAMFILSQEDIVSALDRAHRRGVKVEIIVDTHQRKTTFDMLKNLHSDIKIFEGTSCGRVHCKMCILDDSLIVGSANWSKKGFLHNTENLFIITEMSSQELALLSQIWDQTLAHSELITPENVTVKRSLASLRPLHLPTSFPDTED
ncbi:phospholipase D-like domain-containing protein [Chlamydia suis]|uniref:phospholipase D-like domain-containing protein n=1 Tax=Chlamydia suis TaxID=83559 RepID=UPI0009E60DF3|nr:phospholipase D-like domain-containing protein [Chlamydia suis]